MQGEFGITFTGEWGKQCKVSRRKTGGVIETILLISRKSLIKCSWSLAGGSSLGRSQSLIPYENQCPDEFQVGDLCSATEKNERDLSDSLLAVARFHYT